MNERQKGICALCHNRIKGFKSPDHKVPVSKGGTDDLENLQLTCHQCNMDKADKLA